MGSKWYRKHTRRHLRSSFNKKRRLPPFEITIIILTVSLILIFSLGPKDIPIIENEIHRLVNEERLNQGVHNLQQNNVLNNWSRKHSEKMINESFFEHSNYNVGENIGEVPIHYSVVGCGSTYSDKAIAECFVTGWIGSPGHYANMIDPSYRLTGIGVSCGSSRCRATQMFE